METTWGYVARGANLLFVLSASGSYYILLRKIYGCLPSAPVSL